MYSNICKFKNAMLHINKFEHLIKLYSFILFNNTYFSNNLNLFCLQKLNDIYIYIYIYIY